MVLLQQSCSPRNIEIPVGEQLPDRQIPNVTQQTRAQPDITSGPEVRQIVKIRTVRKPDIFLPGRRTFENRKKIKIIFFFKFFLNFFFSNFFMIIYLVKCLKI